MRQACLLYLKDFDIFLQMQAMFLDGLYFQLPQQPRPQMAGRHLSLQVRQVLVRVAGGVPAGATMPYQPVTS